jgi:LPS export ABC transporter protein LptC
VLVQRNRRPTFKPIESINSSAASPSAASPSAVASNAVASNAVASPQELSSGLPLNGTASSPSGELPAGVNPLAGTSPFTLNQFQRSEMKDGKKIWEVKAAQGQYFPSESRATVRNAELYVYSKNGEQVTLWADSGDLYLSGPSLSRAEVQGRVRVVRNDELTITTERALYDKEKNLVHIPGSVKIESAQFDVSGEEMTVDLESRVVRLSKNVETVVRPAAKNESAHVDEKIVAESESKS